MKNLMIRLWKEEEGQDLTEYALLVVLIALVAITAVTRVGDRGQQRVHKRASNLTTT